jgi:hypothetical protein
MLPALDSTLCLQYLATGSLGLMLARLAPETG